jgi:putative salt-induced outer membrane protein YdiY
MIITLALVAAIAADTTPKSVVKVPPKVPPVRFTGDAGFVSTSGNSTVQTLNLGDKIVARLDALTFTQQFAVVHGETDGSTVASSWRGMVRTDLAVRDGVGVYGSVTYERNTLAGLAGRVGTVTGLSAQLLKSKTDKLVLEGGVSITSQRGTVANLQDQDFLGGRAATSYVHQLGPRASIAQSIELLPNFRESADLRINTETALLAPFTHKAAVKLSYTIHYDGVPEPGFYNTDRLFTSGIQITL